MKNTKILVSKMLVLLLVVFAGSAQAQVPPTTLYAEDFEGTPGGGEAMDTLGWTYGIAGATGNVWVGRNGTNVSVGGQFLSYPMSAGPTGSEILTISGYLDVASGAVGDNHAAIGIMDHDANLSIEEGGADWFGGTPDVYPGMGAMLFRDPDTAETKLVLWRPLAFGGGFSEAVVAGAPTVGTVKIVLNTAIGIADGYFDGVKLIRDFSMVGTNVNVSPSEFSAEVQNYTHFLGKWRTAVQMDNFLVTSQAFTTLFAETFEGVANQPVWMDTLGWTYGIARANGSVWFGRNGTRISLGGQFVSHPMSAAPTGREILTISGYTDVAWAQVGEDHAAVGIMDHDANLSVAEGGAAWFGGTPDIYPGIGVMLWRPSVTETKIVLWRPLAFGGGFAEAVVDPNLVEDPAEIGSAAGNVKLVLDTVTGLADGYFADVKFISNFDMKGTLSFNEFRAALQGYTYFMPKFRTATQSDNFLVASQPPEFGLTGLGLFAEDWLMCNNPIDPNCDNYWQTSVLPGVSEPNEIIYNEDFESVPDSNMVDVGWSEGLCGEYVVDEISSGRNGSQVSAAVGYYSFPMDAGPGGSDLLTISAYVDAPISDPEFPNPELAHVWVGVNNQDATNVISEWCTPDNPVPYPGIGVGYHFQSGSLLVSRPIESGAGVRVSGTVVPGSPGETGIIKLIVNTKTGLADAYFDGERIITDFDLKGTLSEAQFSAAVQNYTQFMGYYVHGSQMDDFMVISSTMAETCQEVWLKGFGFLSDLNDDCYIDLLDFAELAETWTP